MPHRPRPIRAWRLPTNPPAPTGQAAATEAALDHELVRTLGALPLLLPLFERLGLRELVNRRGSLTGADTAELDLGVVTLVLVLNRLLAPKPLVHVETWLAGTALPDLLGLDAAKCNDDRLARALDALAPHLDALWQDLVVAAIMTFDLDLSRLCYDITSLSFCGDYEQAELIRFGYSRDHRPDRKQLELAATVTARGGVPTDYRVLAGNVADGTTPVENLRRLQALLAALPRVDPTRPPVVPLVISDRAMLTAEALAAYTARGAYYLGPLDPGLGGGAVRALLAEVPADELAASPLRYRPQRAADASTFEPYHGVARELWVRHPQADQPPLRVRALVVWSPGKARLDAQRRQTDLHRLEQALADLAPKVGRRPYTTVAAVDQRVATLLRRQRARAFVTVTVAMSAGRPTLSWTRDEAALAAAAALDGRYVLGTNAPTLDADQMLARSKERDVPEKRFATIKGPLAVRPVYLHTQGRILGLVFCTMVALLAFALLELLARRAGLARSGRALLQQFAALAVLVLVFTDGSQLRRVTGRAPPLADTLAALGLPPAEHYLTVHA
jgi:transposase